MRSFSSRYEHYGKYYNENTVWQGGFGKLILSKKGIAHPVAHGQQSTFDFVAKASQNHPIF